MNVSKLLNVFLVIVEALAQEPQGNPDPSAFNPWGKPGNGAPMTDNNGNIVAANRGKAFMDKMGIEPQKSSDVKAKQDYLSTLSKSCVHNSFYSLLSLGR